MGTVAAFRWCSSGARRAPRTRRGRGGGARPRRRGSPCGARSRPSGRPRCGMLARTSSAPGRARGGGARWSPRLPSRPAPRGARQTQRSEVFGGGVEEREERARRRARRCQAELRGEERHGEIEECQRRVRGEDGGSVVEGAIRARELERHHPHRAPRADGWETAARGLPRSRRTPPRGGALRPRDRERSGADGTTRPPPPRSAAGRAPRCRALPIGGPRRARAARPGAMARATSAIARSGTPTMMRSASAASSAGARKARARFQLSPRARATTTRGATRSQRSAAPRRRPPSRAPWRRPPLPRNRCASRERVAERCASRPCA